MVLIPFYKLLSKFSNLESKDMVLISLCFLSIIICLSLYKDTYTFANFMENHVFYFESGQLFSVPSLIETLLIYSVASYHIYMPIDN